MAGIDIDIRSNVADVLRALESSAAVLRERLERELGEVAVEYQQDLRGPGPGLGLTPFRTGNLLLSGNVIQRGLDLTFLNDVKDPRTGAEYAEWAHFSGRPTGDYAAQTAADFRQRFGEELPQRWAAVALDAARGVLGGGR